MTVSINSVIKHPAAKQKQSNENVDLKELLNEIITEKSEAIENFEWVDEDTLEVKSNKGFSLHTFILEAEKLGKNISFEKKMLIKITD